MSKTIIIGLRYSKSSGLFYKSGTNIIRHGHKLNGYRAFKINGKVYYAHRLAWFLVTGRWQREIDHKNGERWDNRWSNLREATSQQNSFNRKSISKYGKGVIFVNDSFRRKPYAAKIVINGKPIYLGYFSSPQEAHVAYKAAAKMYYGKFARTK